MKNKTTVVLTLIFLISVSTLISGCIDKESIVTEITSSQSDTSYSDKVVYDALQLERNENLLQDIERFNDPLLKNVDVVINNPNVEIISLKLIENKDYPSGGCVDIIVQNNAKTPIWIASDLLGLSDKKHTSFTLLDSGKRKRYGFTEEGAKQFGQTLDYGVRVEIYAHDTVMPKISSDFVYSYCQIIHQTGDNYGPLLNLKSLKYEVSNRRRYATFEVHNPSEFRLDAIVTIHIRGQRADYYESGDNRELFEIEPGETKDIQIPLRDYDPKNIRTIYLSSNKQKQSNDPYRFD